MVKVRFAPSPTGIPHVGNIRTALFDYFFARSNNGVFILRIEDTDQARKVEGAEVAIKESLEWLGCKWDEYVVQSERLGEYKKYADDLVSQGKAREEEGAIRFITNKEGTTSWTDAIGEKEISFENRDIEDFIILKKDGFPTYHLANVVDDHLMDITHVIRGEDWIPSTPKHILLYKAFEWQVPVFAHVPNVLGTDSKKLSKRRGAKSVLDYKLDGYLPDALLNYLMLLGWSPKNDREILSIEEIKKEFSLKNINTAPAIFDERKLQWMNGEYIRQYKILNLKNKILELMPEFEKFDSHLIDGLIGVAQTRMKTLNEFRELVLPFIEPQGVKFDDKQTQLREQLKKELIKLVNWNKEEILNTLTQAFIKDGVRFPALYKAIIGTDRGLPLADTFEILGKERTLALLK